MSPCLRELIVGLLKFSVNPACSVVFRLRFTLFSLPVIWTAFEPAPVIPDSVSGSIFVSRVLLLRHLLDLFRPRLPDAAVGLPPCAVGPCFGLILQLFISATPWAATIGTLPHFGGIGAPSPSV